MRAIYDHAPQRVALLLAACISLTAASAAVTASDPASSKDKTAAPTVRWNEGSPGCTFSRSDDGKYHYGLWSDDVGITLAVDSQELEKVHHRNEPFFGVLLTVHYRGAGTLDLTTQNISLEFVKHFQVVQHALDPDGFVTKVQNDADEVDHQAAREVEKHPEKKEEKEAYVREFQKESSELLEFVSKNALRPATLNPGNPEASGWVLFSTDSKWIGKWKKQEELIVRVPIADRTFEFPFTLPPKPGDITLRKRQ